MNILLIISAMLVAGVSAGGPSRCSPLSETFRGIYELVIERSRADLGAVQDQFKRFKYLCSSSVFSADSFRLFYIEFIFRSLANLTNIDEDAIKTAVDSSTRLPEPLDCIISELDDLVSELNKAYENLTNLISTNCIPTTLGPTSNCFEVVGYANDLLGMVISEGASGATGGIEFFTKANALGLGSVALEAINYRINRVPTQFALAIGGIGNVDVTTVLDFVKGNIGSLPAPLSCAESVISAMYSSIQQVLVEILKQISLLSE